MELFADLGRFVEAHVKPLPAGGMLTAKTAIRVPQGDSFFGISVSGDLDRWEEGIRAFAESRGLLTAKVRGEALVSSDGRSRLLDTCVVQKIDL